MVKKSVSRVVKMFSVLLAVLFVATLTVGAASACDDHGCDHHDNCNEHCDHHDNCDDHHDNCDEHGGHHDRCDDRCRDHC